MSASDKLQTMELIWDSLCHEAEDMSSPSWHKDVLAKREEAINNCTESFEDWGKAKSDIIKQAK